ncbi:hypothetical protein FQN49_003222 [Arthroderma sp. PD_2]|nr:hypothetical protein FQN49_003222 [Arthroderma sp. PD_2]
MPPIPQSQGTPEPGQPSLAARGSPTEWDSWTSAQQGGVLAASLLVFLFFFGLGIFLWQRHRGRERKGKRASRSRRRTRHTRKRPISATPSPPRKKRRTKRVKSGDKPKGKAPETGDKSGDKSGKTRDKSKVEDPAMLGALITPRKIAEEQPSEIDDTPDKAIDQEEAKALNTSLDRANIRLRRRRERRREARRKAMPASASAPASKRSVKGRPATPAAISRRQKGNNTTEARGRSPPPSGQIE